MTLRFAGIDEAGYGPMLGPLCVAGATVRVRRWAPQDGAPDLWSILGRVVARSRRGAGSRVVVADSKRLKLPSSSVRTHPIAHLERGVLAMLGTTGAIPLSDEELFERLGVEPDPSPWMGGGPIALPVGNDASLLRIDAQTLRGAMDARGVALESLRVLAMGPRRFNEVCAQHGTKAASTAELITRLLAEIRDAGDVEHTRIAIDRQSGCTHYGRMLARVFEGLETIEESARASRYARTDALGIVLVPAAEDAYFPVALASMAAKLVRELQMMRFNRYFAAFDPSLKPTAGYVRDARRWLRDAHELVEHIDRRTLIRES